MLQANNVVYEAFTLAQYAVFSGIHSMNFFFAPSLKKGNTLTLSSSLLRASVVALAVLSASACAQQPQGDANAGKEKSAMCGQCHGKDGISIIPIYPNLAGQKRGYMELQLKAFRSGQRVNAAMTPFAKRLSDQDILDLAAYYEQLDPRGFIANGKTQNSSTK